MKLKDCKNFSEVIFYQGSQNPNRVFIHDIASKRNYTFKEFDQIVDGTALFLISKGVKPGDTITAIIRNSPEYCFFYFASIRLGAVFNPMPYSSHQEEIIKNIRLVEPRLVCIDQGRKHDFSDKIQTSNLVFVPVGADREFETRINRFKGKNLPDANIDEDSPACLYYSSGTTADPKGVLFSHRNMIADISSICRGFRFDHDHEVHLVILPLGHTASTNYSMLPCAYVGGKLIMAEDFWHIRTKMWELIKTHRVTYVETVPTVLYSILNIYREKKEYDLPSLRFVGCGSAPLQKTIQDQFYDRFHVKVANLYGLSETGPTHIDYPLDPDWKPGSIGVPLDVNEVTIVDEDGKKLSANQVGEIAIKGENVFVGYFKNDSLYRKVIKNGYFHTGDIGYRDERGIFYFVERKKDLIIKGGINIVPGEIDEVLMTHPAVKESATVGFPDRMFGEEIKSFVVLRDGMSASSSDLLEHCGQHLSKFKTPREITITNEIPKTHSGKLLRKRLKELSTGQKNDGH